nr:hypothetical protein [Candidatus Cloacimonadota bacterium]
MLTDYLHLKINPDQPWVQSMMPKELKAARPSIILSP